MVEGNLFDANNTPLQPPYTVAHGKGRLKIVASETKRFVARFDAQNQRVYATKMAEDGDYVCLAHEVLYTPAESVVRRRLLAKLKQLGAKVAPLPRTVSDRREHTSHLDQRGRAVVYSEVEYLRWECDLPLQEVSRQHSSDRAKARKQGYWTDTDSTKLSVPADAAWLRQVITSDGKRFRIDRGGLLVSPSAPIDQLEQLLKWFC